MYEMIGEMTITSTHIPPCCMNESPCLMPRSQNICSRVKKPIVQARKPWKKTKLHRMMRHPMNTFQSGICHSFHCRTNYSTKSKKCKWRWPADGSRTCADRDKLVRDLFRRAGNEERGACGGHLGAKIVIVHDILKLGEENAGRKIVFFHDDGRSPVGELIRVNTLMVVRGFRKRDEDRRQAEIRELTHRTARARDDEVRGGERFRHIFRKIRNRHITEACGR